jgi:biotin carboxyl carrier protein
MQLPLRSRHPPPSPFPTPLSNLSRSRSLCLSVAASLTPQRSPFISDTIPCDDLGLVEEILVEVGQEVKQDEVIAVIETHKAAIDVKASHAGTVTSVYVEQDEEVYEVQPMFMIRRAA